MRNRKLGRTGLVVSEIGYGTWGIGGFVAGASYGETDDSVSRSALRRALERGITFYDTADAYGDGRAETLLGECFGAGSGIAVDAVVVATKAGHPRFGGPQDFTPAHLARSVEGSLRRLRRERIELLQLHNPPLKLLRARPEILGALDEMHRAGKIGAWGLSTKTPAEAGAAIREFAAACVQANFNLADQRALEDGLLDLALSTDTGLIARTPLAFGFLSGRLSAEAEFPEGDHRRNWSKERIAQWASASRTLAGDIAARDGQSLAQVALRFCLSHPGVSTTIPGMLTPAEVDENAAVSTFAPMPEADVAKIRALYAGSVFASVPVVTPKTPVRP
jgi:aryl-alcohol dehydrogenase-like predicted oxidoreductase